MGGYLNTGANNPYNPLLNLQQAQNTASPASTGMGNFDLNDPTAFLKSINSKLSAALSPMSINRSELRSNIDPASLQRLNINLVDTPPPTYNTYPTQGYPAPYPNQGYNQGGGQQLIPVYVQGTNGPQLAGYVTVQTQQQQQPYAPQYAQNQGGYYQANNHQPINYGYAGQNQYSQNYQAYNNNQPMNPYAPPPSAGFADQNQYLQNFQDPNQGLNPPPLNPTYAETNNSWSSDYEAHQMTENPSPPTDVAPLKEQLQTLRNTKADLKKRLENEKLSPTEKEALTSQLNDIKQEERKLKAEIRQKEEPAMQGGQRTRRHHHHHSHRTEDKQPNPESEGVLNPIVESTIEKKAPL
jgi:hypothetical protein